MKTYLLVKATSIPPGAHWITINAGEGKGQPVLIQPQPDGSAKVIGGAGGSLNHLRLRGVKSKETYKQESEASAAEKRKAKKEQIKADKESGIHEAKQAAKKDIKKKKADAEKEIIAAVAKKVGWSEDDLNFKEEDYAHLSEPARDKVREQFHSNLLKKVKEVIQQSREKLVNNAVARQDAGISELPLFSEHPDHISVDDLNPSSKNKAGLGFNPDYSGRAKSAGLTPASLASEAEKVRALSDMTPEQKLAAFERGQAKNLLKKELEGIREPAAPAADASLISARDDLELVKEGNRLASIEKQARQANAAVDAGVEPKAFVIETGEADIDQKAADVVMNDVKTAQTVAFLSEVGNIAGGKPYETLGGHIGVGAYNSINSLALAVGGDALLDRSVIDVVGIAGAAQILSRRIHSDVSSEEARHITDGVQDWHLNHYMATSSEAIKKARALTDAAKAIEVSQEAKTGADLPIAQELNSRRRAAIGDAQRIMGQAVGEMEANAALVVALKQGKTDSVQLSMGKISPESAIKQVRAIGLMPNDYKLERTGGNTFLTINSEGMDKLAKPISREDVAQVKRNIAIVSGDHDENDWLPLGVANRRDLAMNVSPGIAEKLAKPFSADGDLKQSLKTYIGARTADGDAPADILADVQSADFFNKVGADRANEYRQALDEVAPLKGLDGKMKRAESLSPAFEKFADEHISTLGGNRSTLNKQKFDIDQHSVDALHRALAETPEGTAAYKQIGELDYKDQSALREFFAKNIAKDSPEAQDFKNKLSEHSKSEPEKESEDMFGDKVINPAYQDWENKRNDLSEQVNKSSLTWNKYIQAMGGNKKAYESVQDMIRSRVAKSFVDTHNKLNPASPIKLGKQVIRNNLDHLDATDPAAREARISQNAKLADSLRERTGGKYAAGGISDKITAAREEKEAYDQSQMGFFSSDDVPTENTQADLSGDERHTLGHEAEQQIAGMMNVVGRNFKKGQPTKLWNVSMAGKYVPQQRAIKLIDANKRVVLAAGAGSGKTNIMLGAHAHLAGQGKIKRSLMLVPSIVQGQFNGEALRLLEAGKFKTHIQPGASQSERIAAYKDPDTHIAVMTHQSFRDDMIHLAAKQEGISESDMTSKLASMSTGERKAWAADVMKKEGINFDASFVDEAHDTLNRAGKQNSSMANVIEAVGHHTPYHVYASGDPIKNDASEIHSMLQKMDPERYADRNTFMRRYGADTIASKNALKREMARYVFPTKIGSGKDAEHKEEKVDLSDGQKNALADLDKNVVKVRLARRKGIVDIEAAKNISPNSFSGVPEDRHEKIAEGIHKSVGIVKSSAVNRIINSHADNAKINRAVELVKERGDKQGVIFARNKDSVAQYKEAMEKAGKRVVVITGSDSATEKDKKRLMFNPESGEAKADILISSDAGAVGMNLQSGQYLIQHDIPMTAKTHSQRNARIDRIGQEKNVELIDLVANHKEEAKSRDRLAKKNAMKEMMADPMDGLDDSGIAGAIKARQYAEKNGELF